MDRRKDSSTLYVCDACDIDFMGMRVPMVLLPLVCPVCGEAAAYPAKDEDEGYQEKYVPDEYFGSYD